VAQVVTPLVTAIDKAYFPGLNALYNSYKANAGPGFDFYCIVDGDADLFARVESLGVKTIKPTKWTDDYPIGGKWTEKIPSMFADLQIPRLFPDYEKAIWIDADCIIVDSLAGLLEYDFAEPVAACDLNNRNYKLSNIVQNCPPELEEIKCPFGGLIVFNIPEWNRLDLTAKCANAMMDKSVVYKYGDQSVLSYVLLGNWFALPMLWQTFAHRVNADTQNAKILHWLGKVPWDSNVHNRRMWDKYAQV
jgi:lipopolysaccharide biosynthesis glycosyltransferase